MITLPISDLLLLPGVTFFFKKDVFPSGEITAESVGEDILFVMEKEEQEQDFLRSHVPALLLLFPRKIHDRRFMVNGREKFFENIGCFDLQAAGVDARMAAEIFVL